MEEQEKAKTEKQEKASLPSGCFALIVLAISTAFIFFAGEGGFGNIRTRTTDFLGALIVGLIVSLGCFFIVRRNPKSIWYVPIIANASTILAAIVEPSFWRAPKNPDFVPQWELVGGVWVFSVIVSLIAVWAGKRKVLN